jgi:hypothetical protein
MRQTGRDGLVNIGTPWTLPGRRKQRPSDVRGYPHQGPINPPRPSSAIGYWLSAIGYSRQGAAALPELFRQV